MNREKLIQQIRRLVLADKAFDQCCGLVSYMMDNSAIIQYETVGVCMIAGICVTYCKNFIGSNGNGRLPGSYAIFEDKRHRQTHVDFMESRNAIYAHRDLMRDQELKKSDLNPALLWVHITFHKSGGMAVNTQEKHLHPDRLPEFRALIEFQRNRLKYDLSDKIMALADGKKYLPGEYVLGETFPRN